MPLNLDSCVTPNHFSIEDFEEFPGLAPADEFDLVAPIAVYFFADLKLRPQAQAAIQKLKKLRHPLVEDRNVNDLLETTPDGLESRYNALMMKLVADACPEAQSYIDGYGAFGFRIGHDDTALMGDSQGFFAFYLTADAVKHRIAPVDSEEE
ncbi:hypothetical protein F6X40_17090 [Paraburkholderia sp. UCT31]|uniref:hypothetical protein n=1 Tax=Paraburkholderia sp. UCT31 TaxID=2615209 RepID=UPI00165681F1|nr:hypothetical protein [Paraburkholderia sp. UCT31]MBC8738491.1 hypothetical protein [Paraburkholderia sp. UCT31]